LFVRETHLQQYLCRQPLMGRLRRTWSAYHPGFGWTKAMDR
jgi:hypothetical protein